MTLEYVTLKLIHQCAVVLSVTGFFLRGAASFAGANWVRGSAARTLPHVVDTVLLLSALMMVWMLRLAPTDAPWLMAKTVGLVVYVCLGVLALRPSLSLRVRSAAWVAALVTVAWIVSVALTKSPMGILGALSWSRA